MGISKFPRFGQRIAPATLRDILMVAVPPGILPAREGRFEQLADLDEGVWRLASQSDCRLLANGVVREVHRNLKRIPVTVKITKLSEISPTIPLRELDLQLRTFNALNKRFGQNLPPETEIRDLFGIGGFGARCLVDFLTAVEFFAMRPPESQQLELAVDHAVEADASPEELPSKIEVEISHYPRLGHRIAPLALRGFLNVSASDRRLAHIQLCDLDESVWDRFAPELCRKLALAVVNRAKVFRGALRKEAGRIKLPMPKTNGRPIVLQLEQRTFNCLHARGLLDEPQRLAQMTVADLTSMAGFGEKSLVDLLCSLESQVSGAYVANAEVRNAAERLSRVKEAGEIRADDPRFGLALQALKIRGSNLAEISTVILGGVTCPIPTKLFARRLDEFLERIHAARRMTLEDELLELLTFEPKIRNREMTARLLGWDGNGGFTLETIGKESGMTRERVRQISQRHLDRLDGKQPHLPALDRALALVSSLAPCLESSVESELVTKRLSKVPFRLQGVLNAAAATSRDCSFIIEEGDRQTYVVPKESAGITKQILQLARKSISHWGVTTIEDVAAEVGGILGKQVSDKLVASVVSAQPAFRWLDEASGWFWLTSTARNALLNQVEKVLSVCEQVHISELRSGVSRNHRREGFAPPQRVLLALCQQAGAYEVVGNMVRANPPLDILATLSDSEKLFVDVFRKHGPLIESRKLEVECQKRGMSRATFGQSLSYSPIITRLARCVYGLRGTEVPPGLAESLVVERPRARRMLADYGWLEDGKLFLTYKLSAGTLTNGIVSVPSAMKQYLVGAHELRVSDGVPIGRLVVKDSQAWGLGPLFSRRGGEPGDSLRLLFDLKAKTAIVELGQATVEETDEAVERLAET